MNHLKQFCEEQIRHRFRADVQPWVMRRLNSEWRLIEEDHQEPAFAEAWLTIHRLRDQGICCRMIGAGNSSLVSHLLGLSEIDPIEHHLLYERFLRVNPKQTLQFQFVSFPGSNDLESWQQSIPDISQSGATSVQPMNATEALPWIVGSQVARNSPGFKLNRTPSNDVATFEAIRSGTIGAVPHFERAEQRRMISKVQPTNLLDIASLTALLVQELHQPGLTNEFIRRGVNEDLHRSKWPIVQETLGETRGMILFQEQVMLIMNRVADIPLSDAYLFVKAVCKRHWEQVGTFRVWFENQAIGNGFNQSEAHSLFDDLLRAAPSVACKAHHLSEAVMIYRTAFLRTHYPTEFSRTVQKIWRQG